MSTERQVSDACNLMCIEADRLPPGYRLSLACENGEASLELLDPDGNEIEIDGGWLDAIMTAVYHQQETNRRGDA